MSLRSSLHDESSIPIALPSQPVVTARPRHRLPNFEFSTSSLPRDEQFQTWRASYAAMLDLEGVEAASIGFAARHQVWDLGSLAFSRMSADGFAFAGLAGRGRREPLDHWLFSLLLSGQSTTLAGDRRLVGGTEAVQLHQLGRAFEGEITRSEMLMLFVPRDLCRDRTYVFDQAAFSGLEGGMGRILIDYMVSLARRLPLVEISELPELVAVTRAILLACVAPTPERLEEAAEPITTMLLERARCYIQANLRNAELGPRLLLQELGISRSKLYRLFETSGGVMHYIQHRRLTAAHRALADPNDRRRILDIAESYCFNDGAEFSRAFRREFGLSPSDVRAGACREVGGRLQSQFDQPSAPYQRLNTLLRRLQH